MSADVHAGATTFSKPSDVQLIATRVFDAPRDLMWAAHTQCEHLRKWQLGPEGWTMPTCEIDLRPGGSYRFVYAGPDGDGFQFSGVYREVMAPERIVNTETMDVSTVETVNTLTLTEADGRTLLRVVVDYPSNEVREQVIATGMLEGWAQTYDVLEEYLRSLK